MYSYRYESMYTEDSHYFGGWGARTVHVREKAEESQGQLSLAESDKESNRLVTGRNKDQICQHWGTRPTHRARGRFGSRDLRDRFLKKTCEPPHPTNKTTAAT